MKYFRPILVVLAVLSCAACPAVADEHGRHRGRGIEHGPRWHGEIGRFHEHDIQVWRGGRWYHGRHDGRMGWWWLVGGLWYFYPYPVYPYPDPYQPPAVSLPPTSLGYWYYCADPAGYYPYVVECYGNWMQVPAAPPPASGLYLPFPDDD